MPFSGTEWDNMANYYLEGDNAVDTDKFPIHQLAVNREARSETLRHYKLYFLDFFGGKAIYLDTSIDKLYFEDDIAARAFLALKGPLSENRIKKRNLELKAVKHLIIGHILYGASNPALVAFSCVETIWLDLKYMEEAGFEDDPTKADLLGHGRQEVVVQLVHTEDIAEAIRNFGVNLLPSLKSHDTKFAQAPPN